MGTASSLLCHPAGQAPPRGGVGQGRGGEPRPARQPVAPHRQLEAIVRIAEALSKMKLQPFATEADVEEALRLFQVSTLDAALSGTLSGEQTQGHRLEPVGRVACCRPGVRVPPPLPLLSVLGLPPGSQALSLFLPQPFSSQMGKSSFPPGPWTQAPQPASLEDCSVALG